MPAAESFPDFTGTVIHDRYQLVESIGSGSFGVVYKAIDIEVADDEEEDDEDEEDYDHIVAVKIIRLAGRSDDELAMIEREVIMHDAASDLDGVVPLLQWSYDAQYCYLVLEFFDGGDLFHQSITKHTYLGRNNRIRNAFLSLVDAVQACHDAGIAHRDLKPENILTSPGGSQCYLTDFGYATNEPFVCDFGNGTGRYMSPECVGDTSRQPYDPYLSDIWSLGIILLTMITGQNPWARATPKDADFHQFIVDSRFLAERHPLMSDGARAIVQDLLAVRPEARMNLRNLRRAISSLDTFYNPPQPPQPEHGREGAMHVECEHEPDSAYAYDHTGAYQMSGYDIPRAASEYDDEVARDCSAYPDSYHISPSPYYPPYSYSAVSRSSSRTSSGGSDMDMDCAPEHGITVTFDFTDEDMVMEMARYPYQRLGYGPFEYATYDLE